LLKDAREALSEVTSVVHLIKQKTADRSLGDRTLDLFCEQLLRIAEQTATADLEGLEAQEESIINLLKSKFS
jgi:hypothetical protein